MEKPHGREADRQTQESAKCQHKPEGGQSQQWPAIHIERSKQIEGQHLFAISPEDSL